MPGDNHTIPGDLDLPKILSVFRSPIRWEVVKLLEKQETQTNRNPTLSVPDLAASLIDQMDEDSVLTYTDQSMLETALIKTHLPILEHYELAEYKEQTEEVVPTESVVPFSLLLRGVEVGASVGDI